MNGKKDGSGYGELLLNSWSPPKHTTNPVIPPPTPIIAESGNMELAMLAAWIHLFMSILHYS